MARYAAVFLLLGALAARAAAPIQLEDTVATVDGAPILLSDYKKEVATTIAYLRRTNPGALADPSAMRKVRENTLDELITRELLVQAAKRAGATVSERDLDDAVEEIKGRFKEDGETGRVLDPAQAEKAFDARLKADGVDYDQFRESLSRDILARKAIERDVTAKLLPPSDAETRAYFGKIQAYLASKSTGVPAGLDPDDGKALREAALQVKALSSEGVRVERILVRVSSPATENELKRALRTAQALKKRLDAGEDFHALARAESEDAESAASGGDIGYIVRGISDPALVKTTFAQPVGRISDPVLTAVGYNIFRVTEKRTALPPDYERFKEDLTTFLGRLAQKKAVHSYLQGLRAKAVVERRPPPSP